MNLGEKIRCFRESLAVVYDKEALVMDEIHDVLAEYVTLRDENSIKAGEILTLWKMFIVCPIDSARSIHVVILLKIVSHSVEYATIVFSTSNKMSTTSVLIVYKITHADRSNRKQLRERIFVTLKEV